MAADARDALAELTEITATLGAAYPVEVSDEDRAEVAADETEAAADETEAADELNELGE